MGLGRAFGLDGGFGSFQEIFPDCGFFGLFGSSWLRRSSGLDCRRFCYPDLAGRRARCSSDLAGRQARCSSDLAGRQARCSSDLAGRRARCSSDHVLPNAGWRGFFLLPGSHFCGGSWSNDLAVYLLDPMAGPEFVVGDLGHARLS
jgi:hypothetical protein